MVDKYITNFILQQEAGRLAIAEGVVYLENWLQQGSKNSLKQARMDHLAQLDLKEVVTATIALTARMQAPEPFVGVAAQLASRLDFADRHESIRTTAEILAVVSQVNVYEITKDGRQESLMLQSLINLPIELEKAIRRSRFIPPMVCEPRDVEHNWDSPYLTFNECLISGKGNSHAGNICLDVINTQNKIPLSLSIELLKVEQEVPRHALDTPLKVAVWDQYINESYDIYELLTQHENRFWLTNKVDCRGRLYAHGYHVTTQGTTFRKAIVELADKEVVDGCN